MLDLDGLPPVTSKTTCYLLPAFALANRLKLIRVKALANILFVDLLVSGSKADTEPVLYVVVGKVRIV